jgi:hypothetical protein
MNQWRNVSLAIALSTLLAGCSDNPAEQHWQSYHQQLADDLSVADIQRVDPINIGDFPERADRIIDIPETRDSLLNVYALRECQITSLVAARNNQLGRVAPPSQQWLYELTLWQRLSTCWNSDAPDQLSDENRARLYQLTMTKTNQLPAVSWNAIFNSSEWVKSFSRASQPLADADLRDISRYLVALDYLQQMIFHQFDHDWQHDSSTLENHLKTLQERPLTAEVLRALLLATQRLNEANAVLSEQEAAPAHCLSSWDSQMVERLANISEQWLAAINQLINTHPIDKPDAIQHYQTQWLSLQNPHAPWAQFQQARVEHTTLRMRFDIC